MTTRTLGLALIASAVILAGCQGADDPPAPPPLLTITNSWRDEADPAHAFYLVSGDDGRAVGSFTGEEVLPDLTAFPLAGSWDDGAVSFTVQRGEPVAYAAAFADDNPTRLSFASAAGDLVLVRGDQGRRPPRAP